MAATTSLYSPLSKFFRSRHGLGIQMAIGAEVMTVMLNANCQIDGAGN